MNCNAWLERTMHYCHQCGQENVDINVSIWEIFKEALDEFARFDSKFVRTLVPLVIKPGQLTIEWAKGRRAAYVSPLKLYLTITFFFFLLFPLILRNPHGVIVVESGEGVRSTPAASKPAPRGAHARASADQPKVAAPNPTKGDGSEPRYTGFGPIDRLIDISNDHTGAKRRQLLGNFVAHVPTAIFVMLPVYAAFLYILYIRNGRYYVEHLVFALHCHAFYFLVLLLASVLPSDKIYSDIGGTLVMVAVPVYSVLALKRNYGQGWFKTLFKSVMLAFAYLMILGFALFGTFLVAANELRT